MMPQRIMLRFQHPSSFIDMCTDILLHIPYHFRMAASVKVITSLIASPIGVIVRELFCL